MERRAGSDSVVAPSSSLAELWAAPDRRERWRQLLSLLDPQPAQRVLDVGAGSGEAVLALQSCVGVGGLALGTEYGTPTSHARGLRHLLQSRAQRGAPILAVAADAQALPFLSGTFDAALCVNVLEALPDRLHALTELQRVLGPGGRALVAHDYWESQVYSRDDRELSRRAGRAYADAAVGTYAASDGQMGRHLWGLFRQAGFREARLHVLPLVNTEFRAPLSGWQHAQFGQDLIAEVSDLTAADLDRWRADLAACSARGSYVYVCNLFVCLGLA